MRDMGVRGVPIYCSDYRCSHLLAGAERRSSDWVRIEILVERLVLRRPADQLNAT
jgi:hypothetical protein